MKATVTGFFLFALFFLACQDEPPPGYQPPDSSFGLIYNKILTPSCALSGCHDGEPGYAHPKLSGTNTYNELIQEHVHNFNAKETNLWLVKPEDIDSSFFYQKLIFSESEFAFGAAMPAGGLTLDDNAIEFVKQWIEAGAPKEGHVADRSLIE